MGVFDMAKMIRKAQQAKQKMQQIQGVGSSGAFGIVIDGLYNVLEAELDLENLKQILQKYNLEESVYMEIKNVVERDVKNSFKEAKKHLEKQLANNTSLEDLKGFLQ